MKELQKMAVNTALCNMTGITEEILAKYESIQVNAACIVQTEKSAQLIAGHKVNMNSASIIKVPDDANVVIKNGRYELTSGESFLEHTVLIVNGELMIRPDAVQIMDHFIKIIVNGQLYCPDTLASESVKIQVNGSHKIYPASAVCIIGALEPDRLFLLRAKEDTLYYVTGNVILMDSDLDLSSLKNKNISFQCRKAIIVESLLEQALPLFDTATDILVLPDDCFIISDKTALNYSDITSMGRKIYKEGDLIISPRRPDDDGDIFSNLEYLTVTGRTYLPRQYTAAFSKIPGNHKNIFLLKGTPFLDRNTMIVDKALLEQETNGVHIIDCALVEIRPDVPAELIRAQLVIEDCAVVRCPETLRSAVLQVSSDIASLENLSDPAEDGKEDSCEEDSVFQVNCAMYQF